MQAISVKDIENIRIGQAEDKQAGTGCTVLICENGMRAGLDIRGGGPAGRETGLLDPLAAAETIHALLLSGGSAFGLDAAGGVQRYLEERGVGYDTGYAYVPLVCQSCLYDLSVGSSTVRPDAAMAYAACVASEQGNYEDGSHGVGTGATVGKLHGMADCMASGIGSYAVQVGPLKLGAIAVVNALGDVFDWKTGRKAAGLLNRDHTGFLSSTDEMYKSCEVIANKFTGNTTLTAVITNAVFDKVKLTKIAGMAHNGYARAIRPVHTSADGDSIYALSVGDVEADLDMAGTLAADVVAEAILRAVMNAESGYGFKAARDFIR